MSGIDVISTSKAAVMVHATLEASGQWEAVVLFAAMGDEEMDEVDWSESGASYEEAIAKALVRFTREATAA
jgi:hypothetical protein